jgi:Zn-dependent alcohol dehydrogenase
MPPERIVMRQKIWVVETPGGEFREVEVERLAPRDGEVLVRIAASGVRYGAKSVSGMESAIAL